MSPSPGLRNKGATLAQEVSAQPHNVNIADARDRMVAHRNRQASQWEAAASTLEARANQARVDHERGRHLELYSEKVRRGLVKAPDVAMPESLGQVTAAARPLYAPARYYIGQCMSCERDLWVHSAQPRVPICATCRNKR